MCSQYWNLHTNFQCPKCEKKTIWELQTHFMGDYGSCLHNYKLDERVKELDDTNISLDGKIDDFIGECPVCGNFFNFGADIIKGKVRKVFLLKN